MTGDHLKQPNVPSRQQLEESPNTTRTIPSIRFLDCERQLPEPWANGRGTTRTLAFGIDSSGSSAWRVSLANLSKAAEFSKFPGFERTFLVVGDESLDLYCKDERWPVSPGHPATFSGDLNVRIASPTAPVQALNIMTRRGVCRSHVSIATNSLRITPASVQLLVSLSGLWNVSSVLLNDVVLKPMHGIWIESRPEDLDVHHVGTGGELVSISIEPFIADI